MNPNRMGLEEQTKAHALLAKAANHPDWRLASHALDELMRRLLVLHRLLEAEERLAPPGASKRYVTRVAFAEVDQIGCAPAGWGGGGRLVSRCLMDHDEDSAG
jgi:hypothetical protein